MLDIERLFPSVVPRSYLIDLGKAACSYRELGPHLIVMLSLDLDSALRSVAPQELSGAGLDDAEAWDAATDNLRREILEGRLQLMVASHEDGGKSAGFAGHWLGSAAITDPGLYPWFRNELGSDDLYAIVSERDSAVLFASDCSELVLGRAEEFAVKALAESRKPFGRNLFRLCDDGPVHVEQRRAG